MSGHWHNKPVKINTTSDSCTQMIPTELLLLKTNEEIDKSKIKLDYKVYYNNNNDQLLNIDYDKITNFINTNYVTVENYNSSLQYTPGLVKFYCKTALIIEFFPIGKTNTVGYIVGKRSRISINNTEFDTMEVNFLCVVEKLRKVGISSYMINIITREMIHTWNIGTGHYTIHDEIKSPFISKKTFYHRIINVQKLIDFGLLDTNTESIAYKNKYNNFNCHKKFKQCNKIQYFNYNNENEIDINLVKKLYDKLINYCKNTYTIFEYITFEDFHDTFTNNAFHHFIIKNENNNIDNYICLFRLDTINYSNFTTYKNGYLYHMFFNKPELTDSFEFINKYIFNNNIFDLVTFADIFNFRYQSVDLVKGNGLLHYYLFNIISNVIENHKNGLITI